MQLKPCSYLLQKWKKVIPLLFILCSAFVHAEPLQVGLSTETELTPLYLTATQVKESVFSSDYIKQLEEVLKFDLKNDGRSKLLPKTHEKEHAVRKEAYEEVGAAYILSAIATGPAIQIAITSSKTGKVLVSKECKLTGNLHKDRKILHFATDEMHKTLYNKEGVASTTLLYCVRMPSPDGKWVAEVWESDWDGANAHSLTNDKNYAVTPVPIPHSNDFLYVSYRNGQPKIYLAGRNNGKSLRFLKVRGNQLLPAITAASDKIAFICDASGRADLFIQTFDLHKGLLEKPIQLYSFPRSTQASPTFSPDGKTLAFVSDKDGAPRIYLIPAYKGGKRATPHLITRKNRESSCPAWSPDGKKIAFSAKTNGIRQIWLYDCDTAEEKQLTTGPLNKENPAWAPNSLHLVYNTTDAGDANLYIIDINQAMPIKITSGPGEKHYPAWTPRG